MGIPSHFFIRTYIKFHKNADATPGMIGQRKIIYLTPTLANDWRMTIGTDPSGAYWYVVHDDTSCGSCGRVEVDTARNRTGVAAYPSNVGTEDTLASGPALDQWMYIEVEVQLNTPGNNDGYERLWVQRIGIDASPVLVIQTHNVNIRHSYRNTIDRLDLGEQVDWSGGEIIDEERYLDNFAVSGSRMGP